MKKEFKVVDHFKTKEVFELRWNEKYACFETFEKPKESEIGGYYESETYISHQKNASSVKSLVYNWVRNYMLKTKINWIKNEENSIKNILDVGCGIGEFIKKANESGLNAIGIEPNDKARKAAEVNQLEVYRKINEIGDRKFDAITLWHVLEHLYDPNAFLKEIKRRLNPEGKIYIAVPNFKSYDATYYGEYWAGFDVPRHLFHFSRKSIQILAKQNGYNLKRVYPLKFDSYYVSMLSEKNKTGNINLNWFWQGFKSNWEAKKNGEWSSLVFVLEME